MFEATSRGSNGLIPGAPTKASSAIHMWPRTYPSKHRLAFGGNNVLNSEAAPGTAVARCRPSLGSGPPGNTFQDSSVQA